ncbi:ABC transporter permease [Nocardioides immobilis]|uniref:ABC transporter permease n=1 Tax=Nocardioides immobilis TaxID=2049295 RepID=UPI001FE6F089|nr:ABC transporter permease [Nocardioides immobilis]
MAVATPVEAEPEVGPALESDADLTPQERRRARRERRLAHQAELAAKAQVARAAHAAAIAGVPLRPPTADNGLPAVFKKRYLLKLLVKREISARYQASFLGLLWSYIGPACQFFVYWFVMGEILSLHDQVENFGIHIFCGLILVHFFTETFGAGTRSIVGNKAIVMKLPMPREMFPVASMLVSLFHVIPQLVILVIACLAYGWVPDAVGMAAFGLSMFIAMLLGTGCALLFSAANVYFRDFGKLVSIMQMFIRFSVPMIYPYSLVDDRFGEGAKYYLFNPLADCVLLVQRGFWVGTTKDPATTAETDLPPDLFMWGFIMVGVGFVVLVIGQLVFSKLDNRIPERL